jgi:hypothetical protein
MLAFFDFRPKENSIQLGLSQSNDYKLQSTASDASFLVEIDNMNIKKKDVIIYDLLCNNYVWYIAAISSFL